jgi:hypothetical protein
MVNTNSGGNPGLKHTQLSAIFKTFIVKTEFKLKINIIGNPEFFELPIYPTKPSAGLSNLVRLCL